MLRYAFWSSPTGEQRIYVNGLERFAEKVYILPAPDGSGSLRVAGPALDGAKDLIKAAILADLEDRGATTPEETDPFSFLRMKGLTAKAPGPGRPPGRKNATRQPSPAMQAMDRPGLLTRSGSHSMDPASIPLEVHTTIQVDHREPRQIVEILEKVPNLTVTVSHLAVGDFIISADGRVVIVERKTALDFQVSVTDGRLFDEVGRIGLIPEEVIGVVILEGDPYGPDVTMLPQSVTGAITCISMLQGMVVIPTLDYIHTAYALVKIGHHLHGLGYELPVHKSKPKELLDQRTYLLQALPGVSGELAKRLLAHFGSVRAVITATKDALLEVKGLGPKRVEELWLAINSE